MHRVLKVLLFAAFCVALWPATGSAQPTTREASAVAELEAEIVRLRGLLEERDAVLLQALSAEPDPELERRLQEYEGLKVEVLNRYMQEWLHHYDHSQALRQHGLEVFGWQLRASDYVLYLVLVVTGLGVALAFFEVVSGTLGLRRRAAAGTGPEGGASGGPAGAAQATVLEISPTKMQVTSVVTGVVILVLSLGFLYLFLDRVHEIRPLDLGAGPSAFAPGAAPNAQGTVPKTSGS